jgi:hypothetical protein
MSEWFLGFTYEGQLAAWLVASFLLYGIATQLSWHVRWYSASDEFNAEEHSTKNVGLGQPDERLWHTLFTPWVEETLRFAYYLGIPFLAAVSGLLGADLLGIAGTAWTDEQSVQGFLWEDWTQGAGLALATMAAMAGAWFAGRLISRRNQLQPVTVALSGPLWHRLLHAIYDQVHWAFYRSGPILWSGDVYWGTFAGLALVLLEAAINPALWWALKSPETAGSPLFRLGMAGVSALLFLATQNLWLTLAVHLILAALLGGADASGYSFVDEAAD